MRTLTCLLLVLVGPRVHPQLINGSFEDGGSPSLAGWFSTCACAGPVSSLDVPGGTGSWSVRLNAQHSGCICLDSYPLAQALPWITSGTWVLSGWIKGVAPDTWDGTQAIIFGGTPFTGDYLGGIGQLDSVWSYHSNNIIIPPGYPADSLRLVLAPAGLTDFGPYYAYYDDLSLDQTTDIANTSTSMLPYRLDPTAGTLWVDLHEEPLQVLLIDATGRRIPINAWVMHDHTLQVDVRGAAPGLSMLTLVTTAGHRTLRFIAP